MYIYLYLYMYMYMYICGHRAGGGARARGGLDGRAGGRPQAGPLLCGIGSGLWRFGAVHCFKHAQGQDMVVSRVDMLFLAPIKS